MDNILLALRVVVSLGVVIGAIWFVQRRMSRGGNRAKRAEKPISVVARQNLGPKASVAVVEFAGKRFLLGVTEHGISVLDGTAAEQPVEAAEAIPAASATSATTPVRRASSKQNSRDFAHALDQATEATPAPKPTPARLAKNDLVNTTFVLPDSKLSGSILSASTWKQAWVAVRGRR